MPSVSASKRIEEAFGWIYRRPSQIQVPWPLSRRMAYYLRCAAYNLVRLPKLVAEAH